MNRINRFQTPDEVTDVIKKFISKFERSDKKEKMQTGVNYYRSNNDEIMSRVFYTYAEDETTGEPIEMIDPYKANNKLPHGYFKILVDQKVNYLLGNPLSFESNQADTLNELLGGDFQTLMKKVAKEASKKVRGWVQPYIDDQSEFNYKKIPSEQVIPVYKPHNNDELELVIRYYSVFTMTEDGESIKVNRVEVWDDEQVTYYQEGTADGNYYLLTEDEMEAIFGRSFSNPKYHLQSDSVVADKIVSTKGLPWGRVPFVPLYNNDEEDYDLQPIKKFIDAMDIVKSDFINNLEDFQDVFWILKGYGGQNLNEFLHQVKQFRALKVGEDGEARPEQIEVPVKARKEAISRLENDIFTFGQGVNPNTLEGGNVTNVVIKARFANLDLKADQFEDEVKSFIYTLLYFVNRYQEINNGEQVELDNVIFDRSMIMNEIELLKANVAQKGNVSDKTRLANHPWVDDVDQEIADMEDEGVNYNLDDVGDGSDGTN